jgi:glycogen debranching enzyme
VVPWLHTGMERVDRAFRIAVGDLLGNVVPFQGGLLAQPEPCVLAGLHYGRPWTRDGALNTWYGAGLIVPRAARSTLLSALTEDEYGLRVGGQYWDAIVWASGAWRLYLYTGDRGFLATALEATRNTLAHAESRELDPADGLFRGGACFQDGVAAYPDYFANHPSSSILAWVAHNPRAKAAVGYGLPMKALSTNCLYYNGYRLAGEMARELGEPVDVRWQQKAEALRAAINRGFWEPDAGSYRYLLDAHDTQDRQEGFGHGFAVLFGVADADQVRSVFDHQHVTAHGIPCVWPPYERYSNAEETAFGRHCGTVWPQVNAVWAAAAAQNGRPDLAMFELYSLAEKACRDARFAEIYHPQTGEPYGGLQETAPAGAIALWKACDRQTWCATGYIYMVLSVLLGLRFSPAGIALLPYLPREAAPIELSGLLYRGAQLDLVVERRPGQEKGMWRNGIRQDRAFVPSTVDGAQEVHLYV